MSRNSETSPSAKPLRMLLFVVLLSMALTTGAAAEGIEVRSAADLPTFSFPMTTSASELIRDEAAFAKLTTALSDHLAMVFDDYEISDAATLQKLLGARNAIAFLAGDYDAVLAGVEEMRELETKEASRLTMGMTTGSWIAARREAGDDEAMFRQLYARNLTDRVTALPWQKVQDVIKESKGRAEFITENLLFGVIQAQIDPVVAKNGEVSFDVARQLVNMRMALRMTLPYQDVLAEVYGAEVARHTEVKVDIWAARDVVFEAGRDLAPVMIGIWDSGVDVELYGEAVFVNPAEKVDGTDTDGNGFVDDVHGIAWDVDGLYSTDLLQPLGEAADRIDEIGAVAQGFNDLQAAIDSEEASALRAHLGGLPPEEVNGFLEDMTLYSLYCHGTHVAGIALAGNPYAKVLPARISFDYHSTPQAVTMEIAERHADSYRRAAQYFADHGVRVVNMSWGWTLKEVEGTLEANGLGGTADERAELAGRILDLLSDGLNEAISAHPEILFVVAAGNDDNDVNFDRVIPSNFDLPNMIVVGAVDQAGEPTDFTSTGKNVVVYSNGFEVDSYVPGGHRMKFSGTSMSAPNVCNVAAKLLVLKPELTTGELIDLIENGADVTEAHQQFKLLNPKASIALID